MKKITKALWWCSGAKPDILEQDGNFFDRAKYFGIGGTILFTALMAAFAGGYAFFTAFQEVESVIQVADFEGKLVSKEIYTSGSYFAAIFFGIFWGLLIFNLDRYIVTTIKDDGEPSISKAEWKNAAPRLIMAVLLGLVIATPLELKFFEKEIKVEVQKMIGEERDKLRNNEKTNIDEISKVKQEISDLNLNQDKKKSEAEKGPTSTIEDAEISRKENELIDLDNKIKENYKQWYKYNTELNNIQGDPNNTLRTFQVRRLLDKFDNTTNGNVNKRNILLDEIKELQESKFNLAKTNRNDFNVLKDKNRIKQEALEKKLDNLEKSHFVEVKNNDEVAKQFNGLMAKLEALNRLSSDHITLGFAKWLITLLLIFIEVAPVLFKLMTESGPYDNVVKRMKHESLVNEMQKISDINDRINTDILISTEKNKGRLDAELKGNKELLESIAFAQSEIARRAVEKWKENEIEKIEITTSHIIQSNNKVFQFENKFWSYKITTDVFTYVFKNGTSNELWLKSNDSLIIGKWFKVNNYRIEIEINGYKKIYDIEELTDATLLLCEAGTTNKLQLTAV